MGKGRSRTREHTWFIRKVLITLQEVTTNIVLISCHRVVYITGTPRQIEVAKVMVFEYLGKQAQSDESDSRSSLFTMPTLFAASLFVEPMHLLQDIMHQTGANIHMSPSGLELGQTSSILVIVGTTTERDSAIAALTSVLNEWTAQHPAPSTSTCLKMVVPTWAPCQIVGPTGKSLFSDIGTRTNTSVILESATRSPSTSVDARVVIIVGELADIFLAQEQFLAIFRTFYGMN